MEARVPKYKQGDSVTVASGEHAGKAGTVSSVITTESEGIVEYGLDLGKPGEGCRVREEELEDKSKGKKVAPSSKSPDPADPAA
jgi:ribosomal protein L24